MDTFRFMILSASVLFVACQATIDDPSQTWPPPTGDDLGISADGDATVEPKEDGGAQPDEGSSPDSTGLPDTVHTPDGVTYTVTPPTFACVPGEATSVAPLRRLTRTQYINSLRDLMAYALGDSAAAEALITSLKIPLAQIPEEGTHIKNMGQDITQAQVEGHYETAEALTQALTSDLPTLSTVVGSCATDSDTANDNSCIDDFIARFGMRAFRRPLSAADSSFLRGTVYNADGFSLPALQDLIIVILMAPQFVFQTEFGDALIDGSSDTYSLTAFELASRLSYHFWQSMPDDELFAAAQDGSLLTEAGYKAQVERLFAHQRTAEVTDGFFTQWLDLESIPQPADEVGTEPFDTFAGADLPTGALQGHMAEEILAMTRYYIANEGVFDDLFLSEYSFAAHADLAALYDVPVWDGVTDPPPSFVPGERNGLLTRAAFLVSGTWHTLPIHKGVVIRHRILCDDMGMPPEGAQNQKPEITPPYTQREYAKALTEQEGSSCLGCHRIINPLGLATENYDALGRVRDQEFFWLEDDATTSWLDIDTAVVPAVHFNDPRSVSSGVEASHLVVESGKPQACFARYYFRHTFGRLEDFSEDACVLDWVREGLMNGTPLAEVVRDIALRPEFKLKRLGSTP